MSGGMEENLAFEAAKLVCHMPSNEQAFAAYLQFQGLLKGWRFVLASDRGPQAGYAVNKTFGAGAMLKSPFVGEHIVVIDEHVAQATLAWENATYPIDFSISLDTQAVSCIEPYLGKRTSGLPKDFEEVFFFLAKKETNFDPLPYMLENLRNIKDPLKHNAIYKKVRGYEILKSIDAEQLRINGQAVSKLSDEQLNKATQETVASMWEKAQDHPFFEHLDRIQTIFLVIIMKCICIQLDKSKQSLHMKIKKLVHFMDQSLQSVFLSEVLLGKRYFLLGQKLKFFEKIHRGRDNLLPDLNAMAWDLYHFRQMTHMLSKDLAQDAHYYFPAMLTFDKGFADILDIYTIRACGIGPGVYDFVTAPVFNFFEEICSGMINQDRNEMEVLFSTEAVARRSEVARRGGVDIQSIARSLSRELASIIGRPLGSS